MATKKTTTARSNTRRTTTTKPAAAKAALAARAAWLADCPPSLEQLGLALLGLHDQPNAATAETVVRSAIEHKQSSAQLFELAGLLGVSVAAQTQLRDHIADRRQRSLAQPKAPAAPRQIDADDDTAPADLPAAASDADRLAAALVALKASAANARGVEPKQTQLDPVRARFGELMSQNQEEFFRWLAINGTAGHCRQALDWLASLTTYDAQRLGIKTLQMLQKSADNFAERGTAASLSVLLKWHAAENQID